MSEDKDLSLIERAVSRMGERSSGHVERSMPEEAPAGSEPARPIHAATSLDPPVPSGSARPVVELNLARLKAAGYTVPSDGHSLLAEECRMVKRPLLSNAFGSARVHDANLVMVTSTYPGEGKTFTSVNLALSIAKEIDKTVLLIDADVGRSNIHRVLGTPSGPGLLDLLLDDQLSLADVIVNTSIPNLRIVPKGRSHNLATELLASNGMARITRELADRYPDRIVIFDSPPLLITSEAVVLSSYMGQILFVVESERTPQSGVKAALALLDPGKPIGLLLNKTRKSIGTEYYGYGAYSHAEGVAA